MTEETTTIKPEEAQKNETEKTLGTKVERKISRFTSLKTLGYTTTLAFFGACTYFGTDKLVDKFKPALQYPTSLRVNQLSELETQTFGKIEEPNFVFGYSSESKRDPQVIVQGRNLTDIRTEKKQEEARNYQERSNTLRNALYK